MNSRLCAYSTAQLVIINASLYAKECDRGITRYRMSDTTLRRIARRGALRSAFLSELEDELAELGWRLFRKHTEFGVMSLVRMDTWVKLSAKRLSERGLAHSSKNQIDDEFNKMFPPIDDEDAEMVD